MAKIFLNHPISDDDTRRAVFDADAARREAAGRTNVSVLRDVDDPSSVWLVSDGDPDKFNEMRQDPELAAAMQEAGVTGPPQDAGPFTRNRRSGTLSIDRGPGAP